MTFSNYPSAYKHIHKLGWVCHKKQKEHEENGGSERKKIEAVTATIELFQNLYQCSHNVMFWKKQEEEREKKKNLLSLILSGIFGDAGW